MDPPQDSAGPELQVLFMKWSRKMPKSFKFQIGLEIPKIQKGLLEQVVQPDAMYRWIWENRFTESFFLHQCNCQVMYTSEVLIAADCCTSVFTAD